MGGMELLSGREKYRLSRLAQSACRLSAMWRKSWPKAALSPNTWNGPGLWPGLPALRIDTGKGIVTVGGTIDRVDVYLGSDGCRYVRVIDYKTGHKSFRLPDVLLGLNMQMLVYLAAWWKAAGSCCRGALHARGRALGLGGPGAGRRRSRPRRTSS